MYAPIHILLLALLPLLAAIPPTNAMPVAPTAVPTETTQPPMTMPTAPETTTPAPMAVPAPAAPTTPQTSPQPTPSATVAQPPIPQPQQTTTGVKNISSADIDALKAQLDSITQEKDALKKLLAQLDGNVEKAKSIALQARKRSMDILGQTTEQAAQDILNEIKQKHQDLLTMQQDFQTVSKDFQAKADTIQTSMQNVSTSIDQLQAKGVALQVAQEQIPTTPPPAPQKSFFRSWFFAEKTTGHEEKTEPTFVHYLFNRMADLITGAMGIIYATYVVIKEAIVGNPTPPPATIPQPGQLAPPTTLPAKTDQTPSTLPKATAGSAPAVANLINQIDPTLKEQEKIIIQLCQTYQEQQITFYRLDAKINAMLSTLASNPALVAQLPILENYSTTLPQKEPSWKKDVVNAFSQILDMAIWTTRKVFHYIKKIYSAALVPFWGKIKAEVEKEKNAAQKAEKIDQKTSDQPQTNVMPAAHSTAAT